MHFDSTVWDFYTLQITGGVKGVIIKNTDDADDADERRRR